MNFYEFHVFQLLWLEQLRSTTENIICVKGATPGARGTWLVVEDSIKRNDIKEVEVTSVQAEKSTKKDK